MLEDGKVNIYSRNSENNTSKYPDIIRRMPNVIKNTVKSAVIDSEAVAWDPEKKMILPFQVLSTRKRKVRYWCAQFLFEIGIIYWKYPFFVSNIILLLTNYFQKISLCQQSYLHINQLFVSHELLHLFLASKLFIQNVVDLVERYTSNEMFECVQLFSFCCLLFLSPILSTKKPLKKWIF